MRRSHAEIDMASQKDRTAALTEATTLQSSGRNPFCGQKLKHENALGTQ
jgi:hypothetical protein